MKIFIHLIVFVCLWIFVFALMEQSGITSYQAYASVGALLGMFNVISAVDPSLNYSSEEEAEVLVNGKYYKVRTGDTLWVNPDTNKVEKIDFKGE